MKEQFNDSECSCSGLKIEAVTTPVEHAEGPHWDQKNLVLFYVDTFSATAYRFNPGNKENRITHQKLDERDTIGIIVPVQDQDNEFIVAADRFVYKLTWDSNENNTGVLEEIHMVDESKSKNQFNDGKADAKGRLWIGTLTREEDLSVSSKGGSLYRFDVERKVSEQIKGTSISNGIAWSSDNKRFFFSDSETRKIMEYEFDLESGKLGESRVLFDLDDHPKLKGIADGLTIDDDDNLWIALYGGHGVIHIDGISGKLIRYVKLPATYCTSACFGGASQEVLFVTTSKLKLDKEEEGNEPLAGAVFAVRGLGITGPAPYDCILI